MIALLNPSSLALFTALDSVYKAGSNATGFLPSAFVAWIGSSKSRVELVTRVVKAVSALGFVCVLGVVAWQALAGRVVDYLYAGQISFSFSLSLLVGVSVFAGLFIYSVELLVLVPTGASELVFRWQLISSTLGIALFFAVSHLGATYAFAVYLSMLAVRGIAYLTYLVLRQRGRASSVSPA